MGIHSAGGAIIYDTSANAGASGAAVAVDDLSKFLCGIGKNQGFGANAGWDFVEHIKAEISFTAAFFSVGTKITFDIPIDHGGTNPTDFTFTDGSIPGNVPIGSTVPDTLQAFGVVVHDSLHWNFSVTGNEIRFTEILYQVIADGPPPTIDTITNMIKATVTPSGTIGFFDYSPDGVGQGRTHEGGHKVRSQKVAHGTALTLNITTNAAQKLSIAPDDLLVTYDGVRPAWTILANRYQFFLITPGGGADTGTFFFAGHLYPSRGLTFCNYMTGPQAISGGSRDGFFGFAGIYYVNTGAAYTDTNSSSSPQTPMICIPGFSSHEELLNPFNGIPTQYDDGTYMVFDAFLAAPSNFGDTIRILGWIWDAVLYNSVVAQDDTAVLIGSKQAYCVISQIGNKFNTYGSLIVQRES